jgi:transposase-like protein
MTQLHKAVEDLPLLTVSTDACKGLENAVKYVFPMAEQRECFKHLMDNFVKRFSGKEYMYSASRAYRKDVNDYHIFIVKYDPRVKHFLDTYHQLKWSRNGFNAAIKCDYITNNIAKIFNNWIKEIKDLPVCELADKLKDMIMGLWHKRRRIGQRIHGYILPVVLHVLKAQTRAWTLDC